MQDYNLKNPGIDRAAQTLRKSAAHSISNLEGVVANGGVPEPDLAAFFLDAAAKTPGYVPPDGPEELPANKAIVEDGASVVVRNGGNVQYGGPATVAVGQNKLTYVRLPAATGLTTSGTAIPLYGFDGISTLVQGTASVVTGSVSKLTLPAGAAVVTPGKFLYLSPVGGEQWPIPVTTTVAAGVVGITVPATSCLLGSNQNVSVGGKVYNFTIAGGKITAITVT